MALATTTTGSAVTVNDNSIVVASATSFLPGRLVLVDCEWMQVAKNYVSGTTIPVTRGLDGSVTAAHVSGCRVTHGLASDFATPPAGIADAVTKPLSAGFRVSSYVAAGAIQFGFPFDIAIIIGTATIAMTVAAPTKDQDGCLLLICGEAKSASTVQFAGTVGLGNAGSSYDVMSAQNAGNVSMLVVAVNGFWNLVNAPVTGTSTALSWGVA